VTAGHHPGLLARPDGGAAGGVRDVMTHGPRTAAVGELASAAVHRMEEAGVMALPVVDEAGVLRGVVHLHDLLRSGAV
jgi:arabinose-5-phosphate isomerase